MRQVVLNVKDDRKYSALMKFLKEIDFVEVEKTPQEKSKYKKLKSVPDFILTPIKTDDFVMYRREELYER